jgi:hypothetical protein
VHTGVAVCTVLSTHTDPIEAIAIQVAEVRAVAVLINAIVGDLLRSRERRRVSIVAVRTASGTHMPIPIHIIQVCTAAVLINAIVGDLLRSRERRRVPVIAVDKRGEAVTVHICGRAIVCICVRIVSRIVPVRRSTV